MRRLCWVGLAVAISGTACGRQDADRLARIGGKLAEKVQQLLPERTPIGAGWGATSETSLEGRVRARIDSDKYLAELHIEVIATIGGVRLRGTVDDDALKRRAVELAE